MARIGETDSRWIVSRRSDGKNVQNWHWTEKDLFPWCKDRFEEVFKNNKYKVESSKADLSIKEVDSVNGDMIVCNRKGKTLYVFDISLKLKWEGKAQSSDNEVITAKGIVHIDDISNTEEKFKITVKIDEETPKNRFLREEMQSHLSPKIDQLIDSVLDEMKAHASPQEQVGVGEIITPPKPVLLNTIPASTTTSETTVKNTKLTTKKFKQVVTFNVPPNVLYETFIDQQRVCAFTGGPSKVENRVGSEFILFDGAVQGIQEELNQPTKIVQKWRFNSWPEKHYSHVTLTFEPSSDSTVLTLTQTDVPASDYERTRDGWEVFFWRRIKSLFGWEYKIKD